MGDSDWLTLTTFLYNRPQKFSTRFSSFCELKIASNSVSKNNYTTYTTTTCIKFHLIVCVYHGFSVVLRHWNYYNIDEFLTVEFFLGHPVYSVCVPCIVLDSVSACSLCYMGNWTIITLCMRVKRREYFNMISGVLAIAGSLTVATEYGINMQNEEEIF